MYKHGFLTFLNSRKEGQIIATNNAYQAYIIPISVIFLINFASAEKNVSVCFQYKTTQYWAPRDSVYLAHYVAMDLTVICHRKPVLRAAF